MGTALATRSNSPQIGPLKPGAFRKFLKFHNPPEISRIWLSLLFVGWKKAYNDFHVKAINGSSVQLFVKAIRMRCLHWTFRNPSILKKNAQATYYFQRTKTIPHTWANKFDDFCLNLPTCTLSAHKSKNTSDQYLFLWQPKWGMLSSLSCWYLKAWLEIMNFSHLTLKVLVSLWYHLQRWYQQNIDIKNIQYYNIFKE